MFYHNEKIFKEYMREKKATDKLAKIFRINIGRTLKSIKRIITIRENLMMKEAATLWPEHCGILYCPSTIPHPPEQWWP